MTAFLQRYERGEREPVWAELTALGGGVRAPGVYDDAVAVAGETMRRARHNLEILIPRLRELGYKFTYPKPLEPPARNTSGDLRELEKILKGPLPLSLQAWWQEVGRVSILGRHPQLNPAETGEDVLPDPLDFAPLDYALSSVEDWLEEGDDRISGLAPPTRDWEAGIKMWRDQLQQQGMANAEINSLLAPSIARFEAQDSEREKQIAAAAKDPVDTRFPFDFAPDELHKANISGATYDVMLPDSTADFHLMGAKGNPWFVAYLRQSFAWGGFPGWAGHKCAPKREIEILTKDMLPL